MKQTVRSLFSLAALIACVASASADVDTPYSMYGYGVVGDRATSLQRQMGGVGYAMQSGRQINAMNPASYACVDSLTFLFDMGANFSMQWSKEGNDKNHADGGGLDYVTMQFPLSKHIGMSVGMLPVTQVGYAFGSEIKFGTSTNQGSGGINQAYLGIGGKVGGFSAGVNVSYDFGTIQNDVYATPSASSQSLFERIMQVRDWNLLLGVQYNLALDRYNSITAGVTFAPKKTFHGKTWLTLQDLTSQSTPDTVAYADMKNRYYNPQSLGFGLSYKHEKVHHILVEADFTWQQWSKAECSSLQDAAGQTVFQGMHFADRRKFAIGGEYAHNIRGNYLERMPFRIGAFFTQDYLRVKGNQVKEYGLSLGAGFNAPEGKTVINLGLEWRRRRAYPTAMLSENFFNIMLGINVNEVWFWKRRIR